MAVGTHAPATDLLVHKTLGAPLTLLGFGVPEVRLLTLYAPPVVLVRSLERTKTF